METVRDRCQRLTQALEEIIASETVLLRARDFGQLGPVQARAGTLIEELTRCGAEAGEDTRAKIRDILQHRQQTRTWLIAEMSSVTRQLESLDSTRVRLNRLRPAYAAAESNTAERWCGVA